MYGEFDLDQAFFGVKSLFLTNDDQKLKLDPYNYETLTAYMTFARARAHGDHSFEAENVHLAEKSSEITSSSAK